MQSSNSKIIFVSRNPEAHLKPSFRNLSMVGFLACAGGLLFALFLQHFMHLEPCPMCIFQRIAMAGAGLVFLLAALHNPAQKGQWIYVGLADLCATLGALIAARHVWLQHLPEDQVPACGPTLDYLLDMLPVMEVVQMVLRGDGNCAKVDAAWLGLSLPAWTLVGFLMIGLWAFFCVLGPKLLAQRANPSSIKS